MFTPSLALAALLLAPAPAPFAPTADTKVDRVTDDIDAVTARWAKAASAVEADLHVVADGRVLFITHSTRRKLKKELALIEETLDLVDDTLPSRPVASLEGADKTRGRMPDPTDQGPMVLLQPANETEYAALLEDVTRDEPYLKSWKNSARGLQGFTLTQPLVAMWIEVLDGQEEYDVKNELVHRLAHLTMARRFGELPFWLQTGFAWHFEEELLDGVYCFPHRNEFVYETEHTSWDKDLARAFKGKKGADDFFAALTTWKRGQYRDDPARQAFGMARFLVKHHQEQIPQLLSNLFHVRATDGVKSRGGAWTLIPGWEPDATMQRAEFERVLGADILSEAAKFFEKGKRYKRPRKR